MADYIKISRSRSVISEFIYIILNILLATATTMLVILTDSWIPSCALVILSKWRIFAVRPRYWLANIKSNLVDITVGVSFVVLIYVAGQDAFVARAVLTVLYAVWLLFIKPKSDQRIVSLQSGLALFLGITVAATTFYEPLKFNIFGLTFFEPESLILVVISFIIGCSVARHILIASDESEIGLLSLIFGVIIAEITWVSYHWLVSYNILGTNLKVPQLSIIVTLIGYAALSVYRSYVDRDGRVKRSDVFLPILFSLILIATMLLVFSEPLFTV